MDKNKHFDWGEIITKEVHTSDNKHAGHVDGLNDEEFIVKDRIIHARYYSVPRDQLAEYKYGTVKLKISEEELISRYRSDRPGYFEKK
ncbi:MAG: hypothetical protein ACRD8W_06640 [Nitrososphaeraceae archaeon]